MKSIQDRFPKAFALVAKSHEGMQEGHDMFHVTRVTYYGRVIAMAEWHDEHIAELAELSCLFHNADRLQEKWLGKENVTQESTRDLVYQWLNATDCNPEERALVVEAVMKHNGKNSAEHSKVTMALRDADRVVNLELDLVIRSGQRFYDKPPVDYDCFFKTPPNFKNPATVMEDLALSLEWVDPSLPFCMQTKTGWELARERARALQWFFDTLKGQLKQVGLVRKA